MSAWSFTSAAGSWLRPCSTLLSALEPESMNLYVLALLGPCLSLNVFLVKSGSGSVLRHYLGDQVTTTVSPDKRGS